MSTEPNTDARSGKNLPATRPAVVQQMVPRAGSEYVDEVVWNLARVSEASDFGGLMFGLMGCEAGQGVSTVAANVAIRAADYGRGPVLVVEANLQRPVQQRRFKVPVTKGLATLDDFLLHGEDLLECIRPTQYNDVHLLAVPRRSAAGMDPTIMAKALQDLRMRYPLIVIDMPPVNAGGGSLYLASQLDGIVLVLDPERTNRHRLELMVNLLREQRIRLLGTVLNRCRPRIPRWLAWLMGIRPEDVFV